MRLEKAMMGQRRAEGRRSRNHVLTEGAARERKKTKQNNGADRRWGWAAVGEEERAAAPRISPALDPITSHRYTSGVSPGETLQ